MKACRNLFLFFLILILNTSCSIESEPIDYGKDACHYCKMTIVDRQHSAEIVTQKGKAFKYDAIECMMQETKNIDESEIALFLIADYSIPGELVNAAKSTYLISESVPSPMGANLSGFAKKENAEIDP